MGVPTSVGRRRVFLSPFLFHTPNVNIRRRNPIAIFGIYPSRRVPRADSFNGRRVLDLDLPPSIPLVTASTI